MAVPCIFDLPKMGFNNQLCFAKLLLTKTNRSCQVNIRRQPEFRLTIRVCHVDMNTRLLSGEEKETKLSFTQYCRCHLFILYQLAALYG